MAVEGEIRVNKRDPSRRAQFTGGVWVELPRAGAAGKPPKLSVQEQKQLQVARDAASAASASARDGNRFLEVNREVGTGEIWALPFASEIRGAFDPKFATMQGLTNRMAPMQRVPGSGSSSDTDVKMFKKSVPNPDFPGPANTAIVRRLDAEAKRAEDYATFLDQYVTRTGSLLGAREAWNRRTSPPPAARPAPSKGGKARVQSSPTWKVVGVED